MEKIDRLVGWRELQMMLGNISRVTAWRWVREKRLPAPRRVGGRSLWVESELRQWMAHQVAGGSN